MMMIEGVRARTRLALNRDLVIFGRVTHSVLATSGSFLARGPNSEVTAIGRMGHEAVRGET